MATIKIQLTPEQVAQITGGKGSPSIKSGDAVTGTLDVATSTEGSVSTSPVSMTATVTLSPESATATSPTTTKLR